MVLSESRLAGSCLAGSGAGMVEDAELARKAGLDTEAGLVGKNSGGLVAPQIAQATFAPGHWSLYLQR